MREWNGSWRCFTAISLTILALGWPSLSQAQYLRIVTDNPVDNTRLSATGTTLLTFILDTNHDRDGSLQTCNSHTAANCGSPTTTQPLNLFGYSILMTAVGGAVTWGTFTPADVTHTILLYQVSDLFEVEFTYQRPATYAMPAGVNTLGTIPVTIVSGAPHIDIVRSIALDPFAPPTNFNTICDGYSFPNTYALGNPLDPCNDPIGAGDWFDADGAGTPALGASADLDPDVINLASHAPWVTAYIEPVGFDPASIDVSTVRLAGSVPAAAKFAIVGDRNGNSAPDLMVKFSREALDPLLTVGMNRLELTGSLTTGESFTGMDSVRVINPPDVPLSASVSPNPLNPGGILRFNTLRPGPARVAIFDVQGRLLRVVMDQPALPAGVHEVAIDGRGERGEPLGSGVYLFRVEAAKERATGKVVILK